MTLDITPVFLVEADTQIPVSAELWDGIAEHQILDWQFRWRPALDEYLRRLQAAGIPRSRWPQSWHWDWALKLAEIKGLLSHRALCVVCNQVTQGMMRLDLTGQRGRIKSQRRQHLVYIDYLEIAPWNWTEPYADPPRYRGIGTVLLRAAVEVSLEEGFNGRIGLHSLPQAVKFYQRCGLTFLGADKKYQHLPYFEMTPEQAEAFITRGTQP